MLLKIFTENCHINIAKMTKVLQNQRVTFLLVRLVKNLTLKIYVHTYVIDAVYLILY